MTGFEKSNMQQMVSDISTRISGWITAKRKAINVVDTKKKKIDSITTRSSLDVRQGHQGSPNVTGRDGGPF